MMKDNTVLTKVATVLTKENTVMMKVNRVLTKESSREKCKQGTDKATHLSYIYLSRVLRLCVTICCRTLSYSFCFSNQTDQGDETEGLDMEGLEMER